MTTTTEGRVPFEYPSFDRKVETWYQEVHPATGASARPLIILHGGPGCTHIYLTDLIRFAEIHKRSLVFYDQVGCGNSTRFKDKRDDKEFWTVELFVAELNNLLTHLKIDQFDLLGHSWGGMLGADYATRQNDNDASKGLKNLVISNSPASMKLWVDACNECRTQLPREVDEILDKYEKSEDYDAQPYKDAILEFYKRHVCLVRGERGQPFPEPVMKTFQALEEDDTVYFSMNGPSEITVRGTLKTWSVIDELHKIKIPTLVLNGEYDEARKVCVEPYVTGIKDAEWVTFKNASHMSHVEKTEEYCQLVSDWLAKH